MTRRQEIIAILTEQKITLQELANKYKVEMADLAEDIVHIRFSFKDKFRMHPAICNYCGFVYREREKVKKPTKCPKCKHEDIVPPLFWIEP